MPQQNIFYKEKDANGLPAGFLSAAGEQLSRLSGSEPVWKVFWTPSEEEANWVEIDEVVSISSIKQEVERELHTFMAMSCNLTVDNTKGQWNRRGFWQNLSGDSLLECRVTDTSKDSIEGLGKAEHYISPLFCDHWTTAQPYNLYPHTLYVTDDKTTLYVGFGISYTYYDRIAKKQGGVWTWVSSDWLGGAARNFTEIDGIVYFSTEDKISNIVDNIVYQIYQEDDMFVLGMTTYNGRLLFFADRKVGGIIQQGIYTINADGTGLTTIQTINRIPSIRVSFAWHNESLWLATADKVYIWQGTQFVIVASMPDIATEPKKLCACQDKLFINHTSGGYNNIYSITEDGIQSEVYYPHIIYGSITDLIPIGVDKMAIFLSGKREIFQYDAYVGWLTQPRSKVLLPIATPSWGAWYQDELHIIRHGSKDVYTPIFDGCIVYKDDDMPIEKTGIVVDGIAENTSIIQGMSMVINNQRMNDYWYVNLGWFGSRNIYEEQVRIWKGFRVDEYNHLVPAFTGLIDGITVSDTGGTAEITLIDRNKQLAQVTAERVTMDGSDGTLTTKLNVSVELTATGGSGKGLPKGATKIPVLPPIDKFPASGKIKIDNEIITYASKIETTDDTSFNGCVRGVDMTIDDNHSDNTLVSNNQWYIAPRMDVAVQQLIDEAGISSSSIEKTITTAAFDHFSYHGKTPSVPPFGICRCMCYDTTRDQYWVGVDDKLYLWQNMDWMLKATPEAGSYIYQIAVWEDTGDVYLITCSNNSQVRGWRESVSGFQNACKIYKYRLSDGYMSTINTGACPPVCLTKYGVNATNTSPFGCMYQADSRRGFCIVQGKLFYTYDVNPHDHQNSAKGIAYLNLTTNIITSMIDYNVLNGQYGDTSTVGFALCQHDNNTVFAVGEYYFYDGFTQGYRLQLHSIDATTLVVTQLFSRDLLNPTPDYVFRQGITEITSLHERVFIVAMGYNWWMSGSGNDDTSIWGLFIVDLAGVIRQSWLYSQSLNISENTDDSDRSFLRVGGLDGWIYFTHGTAYYHGCDYKLQKINAAGIKIDIGIPVTNQIGTKSQLCLGQIEGQQVILGVAAPAYILWQYSKLAVISAFNNNNFTANYGITAISSILKSFAISSGFLSYFDELGKYYFVKSSENIVLTGFAEDDITNISEAGGNLAEYPIVNKAIVTLFDGTTQVYELPVTSESKIKFGLETMSLSCEWINNMGVAAGIAKEIVDRYQLPKPVITGVVRWYPYMKLNSLITMIKPSMGIWVKPRYSQTVNLPTIEAGMRWQLLEINNTNSPPSTTVRLRQV